MHPPYSDDQDSCPEKQASPTSPCYSHRSFNQGYHDVEKLSNHPRRIPTARRCAVAQRRGRRRRASILSNSLYESQNLGLSRRATRGLRNVVYLMLACALGSLFTFYFHPGKRTTAFDIAFSAFYHEDGMPLDVKSPKYPEVFLRSVMPIPCHSHNDEMRHTPLHAALGSGCISAEADIMTLPESEAGQIFVAHGAAAVRPERTLSSMYLEPLMTILDSMNDPHRFGSDQTTVTNVDTRQEQKNGVFAIAPLTSFTLLLDFKTPTSQIWPLLEQALAPLLARGYLTRWDGKLQERIEGPITIVASGSADFETILHTTPAAKDNSTAAQDPYKLDRYIFFDAPLDKIILPGDPDSASPQPINYVDVDNFAPSTQHTDEDEQTRKRTAAGALRYTYNPSNSHLASTSFAQSVGAISPFLSYSDSLQRRIIREQIRAARDRGLVSRYWATPRWPVALRDGVWENLEKEGVGLLSVDDLRGVRKGSWGRRTGGRWWGTVIRGTGIGHRKGTGWLPEY